MLKQSNGRVSMAIIQREFYHGARGPSATDEDRWRLVFDEATGNLVVRHEWESERHSGVMSLGWANS